MMEQTTILGRPALVLYLNEELQPVDEENATLLRVNYLDEEGGTKFLIPETEELETEPKWLVDLLERQHHSETQPRDEQGRFASGGGSGGSAGPEATTAPQATRVQGALRSVRPSPERAARFGNQVKFRMDQLRSQGQEGSSEYKNLQRMDKAIESYTRYQGKAQQSRHALNLLYNSNKDIVADQAHGGEAVPELLAAVHQKINPTRGIVTLDGAGTSKEAFADVLEDVRQGYVVSRTRLEAKIDANDTDTMAAYQEAGFSTGEVKGDSVTMTYGQTQEQPPPVKLPTPSYRHPQVVRAGNLQPASQAARTRVENAVASIPQSHAELIAAQGTNIQFSKNTVQMQREVRPGGGRGSKDVAAGYFDPNTKQIRMGENHRYLQKRPDGSTRRISVPMHSLENIAIHEMGHAYDHARFNQSSIRLSNQLWGDMGGTLDAPVGTGAPAQALSRMTPAEKKSSAYYFSNPKEFFAESYALAHAPKTGNQAILYYGGLSQRRAEEIFKEAIDFQRSIAKALCAILRRAVEDEEPAGLSIPGLVDNGIWITDEGLVYVIVNGTPYQIDPTGTPYEDLEPGSYTYEQLNEALNKLEHEQNQSKFLSTMLGQSYLQNWWANLMGGSNATQTRPNGKNN